MNDPGQPQKRPLTPAALRAQVAKRQWENERATRLAREHLAKDAAKDLQASETKVAWIDGGRLITTIRHRGEEVRRTVGAPTKTDLRESARGG